MTRRSYSLGAATFIGLLSIQEALNHSHGSAFVCALMAGFVIALAGSEK